MKIGFVTTVHISQQFRPEGLRFIEDYLDSLFNRNWTVPFKVYIIDNGSEIPYDELPNFRRWEGIENISYTYIANQFERGITGAWNLGIKQAYEDGCDIINMTNDDIKFNDTILDYVHIINNHEFKNESLFAPVTNGMLGSGIQRQDEPINKTVEMSGKEHDTLNGFFFSFTPAFYEKHCHSEQELFASKHKHDGGDGKWGGQEGEFFRFRDGGAKFFVVGHCWIFHHKKMEYRTTRNVDREQQK